jgi:hypothetical protein
MKSSASLGIGFGIGRQPLLVSVLVALWPIPKLPKFWYRPNFDFGCLLMLACCMKKNCLMF